MPDEIVGLAKGSSGGSEPSNKPSLLQQACEEIANWGTVIARLGARISVIEMRPAALNGRDGRDGMAGPAGPSGAPGAQGPQGDRGEPGATGATGVSGARGDTGAAGPTGAAGATGPMGPSGPAGADGSSISGARLDDNGHLRITIAGIENDLGCVTGRAGPPGADGQSIQGPQGEPGQSIQGECGRDGRGIAASGIDIEGRLVVTYTDGVRDVLARVVGRDGADGRTGRDGAPGRNGAGLLIGRGRPTDASEADDLYLDMTTGDIYRFKS